MNERQSFLRPLRVLFLILLTLSASPAAEPASLAKMSERDFAKWIVGTEWEYTHASGNKRKVWFVRPDVCLYSRVGEGPGRVSGFPWKSLQKGTLRFLDGQFPDAAVEIALNEDLRTATVKRANHAQPIQAAFAGRPVLGSAQKMSAGDFQSWLADHRFIHDKQLVDFPEKGKIRIALSGGPMITDLEMIRPGVACFHWAGDPQLPILLVFSADLKSVDQHVWWGTQTVAVELTPAAAAKRDEGKPPAPRIFTFADGRTVEGTLLKANATTVTILRAIDGKQSLLTTAELGEADRKLVNEWLTAPERQRIEVTANKGKVAREFAGNASKDARFGTSNVNGQTTEVWQWEITVRNETAFPLTGATVEYTQYVGARGSQSRKRQSAGESKGQLTLPEIPPFKSCTVKTKETTVTSTRNVNNYNDSLGRPQVSVYTRKETLDGIRASVLYKGQTLEEYTLGSGGREAEKKD